MSAPSEVHGLLEHLAFEVAQGISGKTGDDFFRALSRHLALALRADFVLIGELQPSGHSVRTLGIYRDGKETGGLVYNLAGTPCAHLIENRTSSYVSGVQRLFPEDPRLAEIGAQGYAGASMIGSGGKCTGLICALTRSPLHTPKIAEGLLVMFAAQASSELERKSYQEALTRVEKTEAEFRSINAALESRVNELTDLKARLERDNAYLIEEINADTAGERLIGASPRFRELMERIRLVADTPAPVLITGETGTGKDLVARALHQLSARRNRPLVKVNCTADSVQNELFGRSGALAGARGLRAGRLEHARGGTLFLDEIGGLPLESQARILHELKEREFEPAGFGGRGDVRVLAATNRNLPEAVKEGRFRADVYDWLKAMPVEVPPLRERRDDIPLLAAHFVGSLARHFGRPVKRISEPMMQRLVAYDWPGNVRELENFLARAVVMSSEDTLDVPIDLAAGGSAPVTTPGSQSLRDAERQHIRRILASTGWIVEGPKGAAQMLQMNPSTLRSLMKRLGVRRPSPTPYSTLSNE